MYIHTGCTIARLPLATCMYVAFVPTRLPSGSVIRILEYIITIFVIRPSSSSSPPSSSSSVSITIMLSLHVIVAGVGLKYQYPGSPGPGTVQLHHCGLHLRMPRIQCSVSDFTFVLCQYSSCSFVPNLRRRNEESDTDGKMVAGIA